MIGPRDILKHSSKISGASFLGAALSVPVGIAVARMLGPELLGTVAIVNLWLQYATWARPGIMAAAYREMPHLIGQGRAPEAARMQNVAMTYEGLASILPALLIGSFAVIYRDPVLRFGMAVAAVQFCVTTINYFRGSVQWVYQRFGIVAQVTLGSRVALPLLSLAGAALARAYGLLAAALVVEIGVTLYYLVQTPALGYRPARDGRQAMQLLRVGLPLSLLTVLYWGFRTADRTMVAFWLPLAQLGFFTFGLNFVALAIQFFSDFTNVYQPMLYTELGRHGSARPVRREVLHLAGLILLVTAVGANLAQASFGAFVHVLVPKFVPSIPPFEMLAFNLVCATAPLLPAMLLYSSVLNRQNLMVLVQLGGLVVNVGLGYLAWRLGWGLVGIAASSVIAQLLLALGYYGFTHRHLFQPAEWREAFGFYGRLAALLGLSALVYAAMNALLPWEPGHSARVLGLRVSLLVLVWGIAGGGYWLATLARGRPQAVSVSG